MVQQNYRKQYNRRETRRKQKILTTKLTIFRKTTSKSEQERINMDMQNYRSSEKQLKEMKA